MDQLTRRKFLTGLAAASALLPLAACGGGAASTSLAPAGAPTSAAPGAATSAAPASASAKPAASPASASASAVTGKKDVIKLGVLASASDAGFYIGLEKGWFADLGIDIQTSQFGTAAQMVAPLSAGQLDAGGGATSAGLNNAIARNIGIKMVADKGRVPADSSYQAIVIRKDIWDAGKVKDYKDLKGLKFALPGVGISPQVAVDRAMRKGGLTIKDLDVVTINFPDMAAAFAGKSIDAAHPIEPFTTQIPSKGLGAIFHRSNDYSPNGQIAVVLYSPNFIKDRVDVGKRFMVGFLRGIRLYNDGFFKKPRDQQAHDDVVAILAKSTAVKDTSLYDKMELPAISPNADMIVQSMKDDQDWYIQHGYQKSAVDIQGGIDMNFAQYAMQQLGGAYTA